MALPLVTLISTLVGSMGEASAQQTSASDTLQGWRYSLPPTLVLPSYVQYSAHLSSDARSGDSRFGMQRVEMELPLSDPRKSGYGNWLFLASLSLSYTHIDSTGAMTLDHDNLYQFTLPVGTMLRREKDRFLVMMTPTLASDFETLNSAATLGGIFLYTRDYNENFTYSVGGGYFPRSFLFGVIPFVNFSWEITPQWTLALERSTIQLEYALTERQTLAAFVEYDGDSWTIHTDRGARNLSVSSLTVGMRWEYNISPPSRPKCLARLELGMPLYTDVDIEYRHGDRDAEIERRYEPTLLLSLGLDMRF